MAPSAVTAVNSRCDRRPRDHLEQLSAVGRSGGINRRLGQPSRRSVLCPGTVITAIAPICAASSGHRSPERSFGAGQLGRRGGDRCADLALPAPRDGSTLWRRAPAAPLASSAKDHSFVPRLARTPRRVRRVGIGPPAALLATRRSDTGRRHQPSRRPSPACPSCCVDRNASAPLGAGCRSGAARSMKRCIPDAGLVCARRLPPGDSLLRDGRFGARRTDENWRRRASVRV
jgi:hypothetical protein